VERSGGSRRELSQRQRRFAAVALAHRRADAVGPVRFTFEPTRLRIDLLRVGRFANGFAFVGPGDTVTQRVPYRAIRGLVRDGLILHLVLDERMVAPFFRFALCDFRREPERDLETIFRRRARFRLASRWLPVPVALLLTWLLPAAWIGGPLGTVAVGFGLAVLLSVGLRRWVASWLSGGPEARRLSEQFEAQLAERLGLEPSGAAQAVRHKTLDAGVSSALAVVARPGWLVAISSLAIVAAVGSIWLVQRYGVAERVVMPTGIAAAGIKRRFQPVVAAAVREGTPRGRSCVCGRVDTAIWRHGMPELAVLVTPRDAWLRALWVESGRTYSINRTEPGPLPGRQAVDLDVAVVNNTRHRFDTLDLVVTFARRDEQKQRRVTVERGLHWPGTLGPGKAVKWTVRGAGSELKVETRFSKGKAKDSDLAAADVFWKLRKARLAGVRLHGAMMLAYLGDERAVLALAALKGLSLPEQTAKERVAATFEPLALCDLQATPTGLKGCVYNGGNSLLRAVELVEFADNERRWQVDDLFRPKHGVVVQLKRSAVSKPGHIHVRAGASGAAR
jgi:hypothetical protein